MFIIVLVCLNRVAIIIVNTILLVTISYRHLFIIRISFITHYSRFSFNNCLEL